MHILKSYNILTSPNIWNESQKCTGESLILGLRKIKTTKECELTVVAFKTITIWNRILAFFGFGQLAEIDFNMNEITAYVRDNFEKLYNQNNSGNLNFLKNLQRLSNNPPTIEKITKRINTLENIQFLIDNLNVNYAKAEAIVEIPYIIDLLNYSLEKKIIGNASTGLNILLDLPQAKDIIHGMFLHKKDLRVIIPFIELTLAEPDLRKLWESPPLTFEKIMEYAFSLENLMTNGIDENLIINVSIGLSELDVDFQDIFEIIKIFHKYPVTDVKDFLNEIRPLLKFKNKTEFNNFFFKFLVKNDAERKEYFKMLNQYFGEFLPMACAFGTSCLNIGIGQFARLTPIFKFAFHRPEKQVHEDMEGILSLLNVFEWDKWSDDHIMEFSKILDRVKHFRNIPGLRNGSLSGFPYNHLLPYLCNYTNPIKDDLVFYYTDLYPSELNANQKVNELIIRSRELTKNESDQTPSLRFLKEVADGENEIFELMILFWEKHYKPPGRILKSANKIVPIS